MTSTHPRPDGVVTAAWEAAMADGMAALERRDFAAAYRGFGRAHGLGHSMLACHLSAHSGLLVTARRERRPIKIVHYFLLMAGAALLDRDHSRERCAVCQAADDQAADGQTVTATGLTAHRPDRGAEDRPAERRTAGGARHDDAMDLRTQDVAQ